MGLGVAFFERLDDDFASWHINAPKGQVQRFADPTSSVVQQMAEAAHLWPLFVGGFEKGFSLLWGEVKPFALVVIK